MPGGGEGVSVTSEELDETARLVLMDEPSGPVDFARALRSVIPDTTVQEVAALWAKYRGLDGRSLPTHDYLTGLPTTVPRRPGTKRPG